MSQMSEHGPTPGLLIDTNPVTYVARNAYYHPTHRAMIYEDQRFTYADLEAETRRWAAWLQQQGVKPGVRVCYLGLNSRSLIFTMLATWWLGGVFMPLNFRLARKEIEGLLAQGQPEMFVVEAGHRAVVEALLPGVTDAVRLLIDDDPADPVDGKPAEWWKKASEVFTADGADLPAPHRTAMDDLAILMFTSGTTGLPKGVQLTFGNVFWNSVNVDTMVDTRPGDVNLVVAPLFHIGALNSFTIRAFVRGNTNLVRRHFNPVQTLKDIEEFKCNSAFLVPAQLSAMAQQKEFADADITTLRAIIAAGAPVPPVLITQYAVKNVLVQQAWGLTETAPFATYLPAALTHEKAGSCGIPMPYTEIKLIDPATGEDIDEADVSGEMCVRGPNVTIGYWNSPEATANAFSDGWFRSGDIGYRDADGYYFIVDRLKDMIITGGENVYPAEVERALAEFPGVTDVAVVGVQDEKWGESVVAVMRCADGTTPDIEEVRAFCHKYLARYKLPKQLVLVNEVPRNGSGKLDKVAIREIVQKQLGEKKA
ncbi:long-chain fatty acid--CoA ligase [Mariniluteicoccus endophyticus]